MSDKRNNVVSIKTRQIRSPIDRVLEKVELITETGCWIFMGAVNEAGYGIVGLGGKGEPNDRAHRITYRHFVGETPKGLVVCHKCDVRACCNPDHLFIGTHKDNNHDMRRKNRHSNPPRNLHVVGSVHPHSKLTESDVSVMRELYASGASIYSLAKRFGVCQSVASKIIKRRSWKHVA